MSSILEEAQLLIHGDRNADYGNPIDDFKCQAEIMTAILRRQGKLAEGASIEWSDIPLLFQAVKMSRECHEHKRDNLVDGAGYWGCLEMAYEEHERRKGG